MILSNTGHSSPGVDNLIGPPQRLHPYFKALAWILRGNGLAKDCRQWGVGTLPVLLREELTARVFSENNWK